MDVFLAGSQKKEGPQKRQLGRHPRIPFSSHQLAVLEEKFKNSPYLSSTEVTQLSQSLQLADVRVSCLFQLKPYYICKKYIRLIHFILC